MGNPHVRFLDIGAADGETFSNSRLFWDYPDAKILAIEGNRRHCMKIIEKEYKNVGVVNAWISDCIYETEVVQYTNDPHELHTSLLESYRLADYGIIPDFLSNVETLDINSVINEFPELMPFNIISVDVEGIEHILINRMMEEQSHFSDLCIWCVETNSIEEYERIVSEMLGKVFELELVIRTNENTVWMAKKK
jgi:FkbM family methyltransferase